MVRDPVGASWWRFDFHTHTPASEDYGKGPRQTELREREPRDWLLDFMSAGIDCVAVTDHNTGAWIDRLKDAYGDLEKHPQRRPLTLFPGVEITVSGGIHVLAILDPSKGTSGVDTLLGEAGLEGDKGSGSASTRRSFEQVVEAIVRAGGWPSRRMSTGRWGCSRSARERPSGERWSPASQRSRSMTPDSPAPQRSSITGCGLRGSWAQTVIILGARPINDTREATTPG